MLRFREASTGDQDKENHDGENIAHQLATSFGGWLLSFFTSVESPCAPCHGLLVDRTVFFSLRTRTVTSTFVRGFGGAIGLM